MAPLVKILALVAALWAALCLEPADATKVAKCCRRGKVCCGSRCVWPFLKKWRPKRCKLNPKSDSCCSKQHPDYVPPAPTPPKEPDECCTVDEPNCFCGSCFTDKGLTTAICSVEDADLPCCDEPPPEPEPNEPDECCRESEPNCFCGSCFTDEGLAAATCSTEDANLPCCDEPGPEPEPKEPDECCTLRKPDCRCGTCLKVGPFEIVDCVPGAPTTCCEEPEPEPEPVDECCTAERPRCICGSFCGTSEQLAATLCQVGFEGTCCDEPPVDVDECCTEDLPKCGSCGACLAANAEDPPCADDPPDNCCPFVPPSPENPDDGCPSEAPVCTCAGCRPVGVSPGDNECDPNRGEERPRCTDPAPPTPLPVDECCTEALPACICGQSCGTREDAAVVDCLPDADISCCNEPPPPPPKH